ncbi:phage major capsid protein [Anaeromyxobacter sp. Red801]|uniref:phage major capsid protein n=1 Tax=Anaeromyxobacter sp. Red801 TaxID=3411632 RepID=UPI003B9EFE0B
MSEEIKAALTEMNDAFREFKKHQTNRMDEIEAKFGRVQLGAGGAGEPRTDEETKAFVGFLRTGRAEEKSLSTDSDPKGGWMVPTYLDNVIGVSERDACPLRQVARVITVDGEGYEKLMSTGTAEAREVGEREERTETGTPSLELVKPSFCEIYAEPPITQKLLDDSSHDVAGWLTEELGLAFGAKESSMFAAGTGVKSARGLLSYDIVANPSFGQLRQVKSGSNGAVVADKLLDVVFALKPAYRRRAAWMLNTQALMQVRQLKDSQGRWLFEAPKQAGEPGMLLGYPAYEWPELPAPATGSHSIAFGDWRRGYTIADLRQGTRVLRDPYTKKGWVLFYTTKRFGGGVEDSNAIVVHTLAA